MANIDKRTNDPKYQLDQARKKSEQECGLERIKGNFAGKPALEIGSFLINVECLREPVECVTVFRLELAHERKDS